MLFTNKQQASEKVKHFAETMLLRRNVEADRTWFYTMERFMSFLWEHKQDYFPNFQEREVNDYIDHLRNLEKTPSEIQRNIEVILTYGSYANKELDRTKLDFDFLEKLDSATVEEEKDLLHTEGLLFEKILSTQKEMGENVGSDHGLLRSQMRNYLMYRLVLETGLDIEELITLKAEGLQEDGHLFIHNRSLPLSTNLYQLLKEYLEYRKKYDEPLHMNWAVAEVDSLQGRGSINEDEIMKEFHAVELPKKLEIIETLLGEQLALEEEVFQLEMNSDDTPLEKIEVLEEEIDDIVEKINQLKAVLVLERKKDEFIFHPRMFVSDSYQNMELDFVDEVMKMEAFPVKILQYTVAKKWEDEGIKPGTITKFLGQKGNLLTGGGSTKDFDEVIKAGFTFPERQFRI
ncbi:MAG: site-specific integrase [Bacillus sp. (in: Bacteria)]|nr:site-specific integrase [Bacillus sp. (in: firmicutes)]